MEYQPDMEILEKTTKLNALAEALESTQVATVPHFFKSHAQQAKLELSGLDFPNTRQEYWKYTRTGQIASKKWGFTRERSLPHLPIDISQLQNRLVFINGHFSDEHSKLDGPDGLKISSFSGSTDFPISHFIGYDLNTDTPMKVLNTAIPQDGYSIRVSMNTSVEALNVVNVFTGELAITQPRNTVYMEKGSAMKMTEYDIHAGSGATFANKVTSIYLEENSHFGCDVVQMGSPNSYTMHEVEAIVERDSNLTLNNFTLSGKWTRNNTNARIKGSSSEVNLNGFYIPSGSEHIDNHTVIDHEEPHCESNELYRGVLMDNATAVFNGKVFVRQDAQKTNAFQSNGNILVSDTATVNSKPELEIYADDVKCSHGSTTGQLDEEALFYLRSRGLSPMTAKKMLVAAFAGDVISRLVNTGLTEFLEERIAKKLLAVE